MANKLTFNPFTGTLDILRDDSARISVLENNEYKIAYTESINSDSGTITKPTGSTILPGELPEGALAIVETIANGEPSGESPRTASGTAVTVTAFDSSGNYTLSGVPSAYPVALIYVLKIKAIDWSNLTEDNIIGVDKDDLTIQANTWEAKQTFDVANRHNALTASQVVALDANKDEETIPYYDLEITDATLITHLTTAANWGGAFIIATPGTAGLNPAGYQGQFYTGYIGTVPYLFYCKADGIWVRHDMSEILGIASGGTGASSFTDGQLIYYDAATGKFLSTGYAYPNQALSTTSAATFKDLYISGLLHFYNSTPSTINANTNNMSLGVTSHQRISSSAAYNVTGVGGPFNGRTVTYINIGSFNITFKHEDAGSTATNRILSSTGADLVLAPNQSLQLWYDSGTTRWRNLGVPA